MRQARRGAGHLEHRGRHHPSPRVRTAAETGQGLLPEATDLYPVHDDFVELSEQYFARNDPNPSRWKTELRLPEVEAGYNIPRRTSGGGDTATEEITNLLDEENIVVLGEAGSGKSVVCRSVACEWYRSKGVVFYRYGAQGELDDVDGVVEMIEEAAAYEEVLVVVEDAARYECRRLYDVVEEFADVGNVRFLVDSRTYEWDQFDSDVPDVDRTRTRSDAFRSVELAEAGAEEREALIETITNTTETVDTDTVAPKGIKPPIDEEAVGTMVQLVYNILLSADANDGATMLHQDVRTKFNASNPQFTPGLPDGCRLTETETDPLDGRLFHKVAIGVNVLNAMGRPIREPLLYGLAGAGDREDVRLVLTVLEGWMLFDDERDGVFRSFPEPWSLLYLESVMDDPLSQRLFKECVREFTELFTDPELGDSLAGTSLVTHGGWLDTLRSNRRQLLDGFIIDLFEINYRKPKLEPLFDDDAGMSVVPIPDRCSPFVKIQARIFRGVALRHRDRTRATELFESARDIASAAEELGEESRLYELQCHRRLGNIAFHGGDFETAKTHYEECLRRYEPDDPNRERALCRANLGAALHDNGRPTDAIDQLDEALRLCEPLPPNAHPTGHVHHHYAAVYETLGDYGEAQYHLSLSRDIAWKRRDWNLIGWNENRLGYLNLSRGRFPRAEARLHAARKHARELGYKGLLGWSENDLAKLERKRGDLETAEERLDEAEQHNESVGNEQMTAWIQYQRGVIAIERDQPEDARDRLRDSLRRARTNGYGRIHAWVRIAFARTFIDEEAFEQAETHLQEAVDVAHDIRHRQTAATTLYRIGQLHWAMGKEGTSAKLLERALDRFDALGCAYEVTRTVDVLEEELDVIEVEDYDEYAALENLTQDQREQIWAALDNRFADTTFSEP